MKNSTPLIIILLCVISLFSCQESGENIKIGAIFSMTGDVGAYGQRSRKGFELAIKTINDQGGINGRNVITVIEDAKSSSKDGVAAFQKLVNIDQVQIIVGDVLSSTTMAIVPLLDRNKKVLLFAPGASNPGLKGASAYFFRNWTSDDFDGFAMAHYLWDSGHRDVGLIVQKSDYTLGLADAFVEEFKNLGGEIVIREEFDTEATDFRAQIAKVKDRKAKTVYLVGQSRENGRILKQSKELGFSPKWFANLTVDTPECADIAGLAREGVTFSTPAFNINSDHAHVQKFVEDFRANYDETPESTSGHAYDAVMILASAIEKVGINPDSLAKFLLQVKDFPGVTGKTSFDENGDVIKDVFIKQIQNGEAVLLRDFEF